MANFRLLGRVHVKVELEDRLAEQVYSWLRSKVPRPDALEPNAICDVGGGNSAVWLRIDRPDGARDSRFRLREHHGWTSTLTAHIPAHERLDAMVWLDVDAPTDHTYSAVPRLARFILDTISVFDADAELRAAPSVVPASDIDSLSDVLCDTLRRGPAIVAATPEDSTPSDWRTFIADCTAETVGMASVFVLDAHAAAALAEVLGTRFAVPSGAIRTYLPGVDPAVDVDARRHLIMGSHRLRQESVGHIRTVLARMARSQQTRQPLPDDIKRLGAHLTNVEDSLLVQVASAGNIAAPPPDLATSSDATDATVRESVRGHQPPRRRSLTQLVELWPFLPSVQRLRLPIPGALLGQQTPPGIVISPVPPAAAPPPADVADSTPQPTAEATPSDAERSMAQFWPIVESGMAELGRDASSPESVRELIELARRGIAAESYLPALKQSLTEKTAEIETVSAELHFIQEQANDLQLELAESEEQGSRLADQVAYLRQQLTHLGHADLAWLQPPTESITKFPSDYSELLTMLAELPYVAFTGDRASVLDLADHDPMGSWARKTWEVLLALSDYASAKADRSFVGGFYDYLSNEVVAGRKIARHKLAGNESDTVDARWADQRTFRVPKTVDPRGEMYMESHVRIATKRSTSPRLYFFDATGRDQQIYVGYIGRHLTNTKSH